MHTLVQSAAEYHFKNLRSAYTRFVGWHAAVQAHINEGAPYPSVRRCPSKTAKHRAYSNARSLAEMLDITVPAEKLGTMHEWEHVLRVAGAELGINTSRLRSVPTSIPTREVAR